MTTCFDRWEKDPFFLAAEEVQESTDRLESIYRRCIHERKQASASVPSAHAKDSSAELLRDLQTSLGTAKWQLEELEKAVRVNDDACSAGEETRTRHDHFVSAIRSQISKVESSLLQWNRDDKETKITWVHLDEGERDELARFLSVPTLSNQEKVVTVPIIELKVVDEQLKMNENGGCQQKPQNIVEKTQLGAKEERVKGHRRAASASAGIATWNISLDPEEAPRRSSERRAVLPPSKTASFSSLMQVLETTSKIKWPNNGFRKWKGQDYHQEEELIPLRNHQYSQDLNACCEKNKGWRGSSGDEHSDKQIYGWVGSFSRQLQRSQYQIHLACPAGNIVEKEIYFISPYSSNLEDLASQYLHRFHTFISFSVIHEHGRLSIVLRLACIVSLL